MGGEGWFGGGADLTPYYLYDEDITEFHRFYKDICDRYDPKVGTQRELQAPRFRVESRLWSWVFADEGMPRLSWNPRDVVMDLFYLVSPTALVRYEVRASDVGG